MRRAILFMAVLAAGAAAVFVLAAPAQSAADLPRGAVVRVGDATISRTKFDHWFDINGSRGAPPRRRARDYRPPSFAGCVARERRAQRKVEPRPTTARLRRKCRADYERLRNGLLEFLIMERWTAGEAAERGVALTEAEYEREFQIARDSSFEDETEFRAFLRSNRMTVADARFEIAYLTLYAKLQETVVAGVAPVTDAEVADHYQRNQVHFVRPELRDLRAVVTKTRAAATAARRALERGQTWRHVARRYSIDRVSRDRGGLLRGIARGTLDKALDEAAFRTPQGKLRGPVKGAFGFHVFKVLKIAPATQRTLADVASEIRERLARDRRKAAVEAFESDLRTRWKPRTTCRAGFVIDLCACVPDPATGPS